LFAGSGLNDVGQSPSVGVEAVVAWDLDEATAHVKGARSFNASSSVADVPSLHPAEDRQPATSNFCGSAGIGEPADRLIG